VYNVKLKAEDLYHTTIDEWKKEVHKYHSSTAILHPPKTPIKRGYSSVI